MQIDFTSSGEAVECKVTIRVPHQGDVWFLFERRHSDKWYAAFTADAMAMQMRDAIEKMRREAYEQGWKDARSRKTPKVTWFRRFWDTA